MVLNTNVHENLSHVSMLVRVKEKAQRRRQGCKAQLGRFASKARLDSDVVIKIVATGSTKKRTASNGEKLGDNVEAVDRMDGSKDVALHNEVAHILGVRVPACHHTGRRVIHWNLAVGLLPVITSPPEGTGVTKDGMAETGGSPWEGPVTVKCPFITEEDSDRR